MTGLDPSKEVIVEIATIVTDNDLNIVAEGPDLVMHADETVIAAMDDFVVQMHTRSGLLDEIRASTLTVADAQAQTLAFLQSHIAESRSVPLCGNSIGTDRRFLAAYMNDLEEWLHYRSIDVSTVKELARRWYPQAFSEVPDKHAGHRALDDIRESVAELKFWREKVFR